MSDRLKMPPIRDFGFYQRRKHDKWREVNPPDPALEAPVADSHAHVHMLPDPAWELARCAANGVDFMCMITDPTEDGPRPFDELDAWVRSARLLLEGQNASDSGATASSSTASVPTVVVAVGVHPHNAKLYDEKTEHLLQKRLADERVCVLGEIGLDYHYDLSPRNVQRKVFRVQIRIAKELGMPIALHLRGGDDPELDNAHAEAYEILESEQALGPQTLLHCCTLGADELEPWAKADCFIAYGGALTFKSAAPVREAVALVPENRLLLETDAPYMTPEPMRGAACTPAHVVFTAAALAAARGIEAGEARKAFLQQIHRNTLAFISGKPV